MKREFDLDYFKSVIRNCFNTKDDPENNIREIINVWEDNRCGGNTEYVANIFDPDDFKLVVDSYGIPVATELYQESSFMDTDRSRFYLIGENFPSPLPVKNIYDTFASLKEDILEDIIREPMTYEGHVNYYNLVKNIGRILGLEVEIFA